MSSDEFDFSDEQSETSEENGHPNKKKAKRASKKAKTSYDDYFSDYEMEDIGSHADNGKTIEETYQKKTQLEHILLRPDTYIGSVEPLTQPMFVLSNDDEVKISQREITYTPGLYKIFDEILVNAADNKQRDPNMDRMEITIDDGGMEGEATISVWNNGSGIPVEWHKKEDCYVPTLIFGHLLTGSNFDDKEKKTTGGRNGYGAKLANIFSTEFVVECRDCKTGLKFKQVFRNNMSERDDPMIKECSDAELKKGNFTKITFKPDLQRFSMTHLDSDTVALLSKRAYDIAGSMGNSRGGKKLNVYLNGSKIEARGFKSYLALFKGINPPVAYEKIGDRWEVGVSVSDEGSFNQISFVNAIATTKGGGHVNYITDLVAKRLQAAVKKKNKGGTEIKPAQIKNHISVFVNCLVENPSFDSQTKENLTTRPAAFKGDVVPSEKFFKQMEKSEVVDAVLSFARFKQNQALKRKGGTKKAKLTGITKLDDANFAGTTKSTDCTLILTEGDSAKSLAVSGLSVVGRDYYGVFPLKGKPLNVRDATHAQIMKNEEIKNLVDIMGLKFGTEYNEDNIKSLRYGHLMIMADQDHDGSHIKGLIINFFHHFWPSLLDIPDFLMQFITPIVKCTNGKKTHTFFTLREYEEWKEKTGNDGKGWKIKYYKGLGTSTSSEAKEYFSHLDIHEIHFNELTSDVTPVYDNDMDEDLMTGDSITTGSGFIEMAFSKSKVDARKKWLNSIDKNTFLDYSSAQRYGVNYSDFINKELILFSNADNARSIPHIMDGLKPSQRKVLFACFKKKLKTEIKVAQLAGYIGEHSAYHHGDMSLNSTIIGMAQSYVGSNNVNLLYPSGQFGTRRMGGKDHASARYIFTRLEKVARTIFHPDDDALLNYLNDDGLSVEPEYYMPVIPMVLVNGSDGIGTGYSSTIQNHDPREIIENIRKMIKGEEPEIIHPFFSGFTGEIIPETGKKLGSYTVRGKIERINDTTLLITELPLNKWTQDYKGILEGMVSGTDKNPGEISDFKENHTDTTVSFTVGATKEKIDEFHKFKGGLHGKFKLSTTISTNNMTAFDVDGKLHKYATTKDILQVFFDHRLEYYFKRKALLLKKMLRELKILENKARFVDEVCSGDLVVSNKKRTELLADLQERDYDLFPKEEAKKSEEDKTEDDEDTVEDNASDAELAKGYEYLLGMKIWSLTFERAEELRRQLAQKTEEVATLEATEPQTIWLKDLKAIEEVLDERDAELEAEAKKESQAQSKAKVCLAKKAAAKKAKKNKRRKDEWDSDLEDSDEDDDGFVAKPAPKPRVLKPDITAKKKSPPMKQLISVSNARSSSKNDTKSSKSSDQFSKMALGGKKALVMKAHAKKAAKEKKAYDSSDDDSNEFEMMITAKNESKSAVEKDHDVANESVDKPAVPAMISRSRRSLKNVSYTVDGSSDEELEELQDDSDDEVIEEENVRTKLAKKSNMLKDEWGFDDEMDADDEKPVTKKNAKTKTTVSPIQKVSKLPKPDPNRVLKSLSHELDGSQSIGSLSPKKKSFKASKRALPKKKSNASARAKFSKKKAPVIKCAKSKPSKSICDLSSDDDDFLDDGSVVSHTDSSTSDPIMEEVAPTRGRKSRRKMTYKDAGSSESEDELDEDSKMDFE